MNPSQTVVITNVTCGRSGVDVTALQLARGLVRRGWTVHSIFPDVAELASDYAASGVTLHVEPTLRWWFPPTVSEESFESARPSLISSTAALTAVMADLHPDVIVANTSASLAPHIAARVLGIHVVTHVHAAMVPTIYRSRSQRLERTQLSVLAEGTVVVPSRALGADLQTILPALTESLHVIHNSVDTTVFSPGSQTEDSVPAASRASATTPTARRIVSLGHLTDNKNQEFLVEVAENLRRAGIDDVEFELWGPADPDYQVRMEKRIAERGLANYFHFAGVTQRPEQELRGAWAYVNSSVSETFPVSVLEALAAGLPVFALGNSGNREILTGSPAGFISTSAREMATDIARLLDDPDYASVARAARERAEEKFSEEVYAGKWAELLSEIASSPTPRADALDGVLSGVWAMHRPQTDDDQGVFSLAVLVADREQIATQLYVDEALGFLELRGDITWTFVSGDDQTPVLDACDALLILRQSDADAHKLAEAFRAGGKPVIFETDDNYFALKRDASGVQHKKWRNRDLEKIATIADSVIVYSEESRRAFRRLNEQTYLLPTFQLPESLVPLTPRVDDDSVTVGYLGSLDRDIDFTVVTNALLEVLAERPNVRLAFAGFIPEELAGNPRVTHIPFDSNYRRFVGAVRSWHWDIGLAPLADTTFNRSKTVVKYREYAAAGIPAVLSDVRLYADVVEDGRNGLLAANDVAAWKEAVLRLVDAPELRESVRSAAHADVSANYPLARHAQEKLEVIARARESAHARAASASAAPSRSLKNVGLPHPHLERFVEWSGVSSTMHVTISFWESGPQPVGIEVVAGDAIIANRVVDSAREFIPITSATLTKAGPVIIRLFDPSQSDTVRATRAELKNLTRLIQVFSPL